MELRQICDDFFQIGNIAILQKKTGNDVYDFDFRNNFECKSVISEIDVPILLHIGAVEDYEKLEEMIESMGMKLLVHNAEHLHCSTIEKWYPALKGKTPYTEVYDELPSVDKLLETFSFPVFIKGNRQTNRHKKSQCIIENEDEYERLRTEWHKDSVLSWQKVAVREYVPLKTIDETSFPNMVPISYEFRFFFFEGKCVGYGPYWYMGNKYTMAPEDIEPAMQLGEWAAERVANEFIAVDLAKTAEGEWIIIEINDAQESGFVGVNPHMLWRQTIDAVQDRQWISVEDFFSEGTVIMAGDPLPNKSVEEMQRDIDAISSVQDLVDSYANVHSKFWFIEDDLYNYEVDSEEYAALHKIVDAWADMMHELNHRVMETAEQEGLLAERQPDSGTVKQLEAFMAKYGYRDGRGWWVKKEN